MIKFQVGNVHTTVSFPIHERDNVGACLQKFLTAEVPGAKFLWAYKSGQWDGKVRLFDQSDDMTSFRFLTGMYPTARAEMEKRHYACEFEDCRGIQHPVPALHSYSAPLRPYQHEVLSSAFSSQASWAGWWPRGIIHVATGGGKTEIAVAMYQTYPVETIFLVHRKDLLLQAQERFAKYGIQAGIIGANKFEPRPGINIVTMQTLSAIVRANDPKRCPQLTQLMFNAKQVFFDEAHVMAADQDKGNLFVEIASWFPNAHARWGLTATPFMRSHYDNLLLEGVTGGILASVSSEFLIANGFLTPPKVKMIRVPGKLPVSVSYKSSNKAKAEYFRKVTNLGIINNDWRNRRIALELTNGPFPTLCLVKTIEQAKAVQLWVQQATCTHVSCNKGLGYHNCPSVPLLTGTSTAQQRRDVVAHLRAGTLKALIATTIFDEGVDIPEIMKVIIGSGGKSQVKLLQRVGRGLRLAANKHEVLIIDFYDRHSPLLEKHSHERKKIWKGECFEVEEIV